MDLASEFVEFIKDVGQPCYIRRALPDRKCSCIKPTGEPDPLCSKCMGLGYFYEDHAAYVRFVHVRPDVSERPIEFDDFVGNVAYIAADKNLKRIDQIIELQLDHEGDIIVPPVITKIHRISKFSPMRGDATSKMVYYMVEIAETIRGDVI